MSENEKAGTRIVVLDEEAVRLIVREEVGRAVQSLQIFGTVRGSRLPGDGEGKSVTVQMTGEMHSTENVEKLIAELLRMQREGFDIVLRDGRK